MTNPLAQHSNEARERVLRAAGIDPNRVPEHVAVIMDGNGRWAKRRGEARVFGHDVCEYNLDTPASDIYCSFKHTRCNYSDAQTSVQRPDYSRIFVYPDTSLSCDAIPL